MGKKNRDRKVATVHEPDVKKVESPKEQFNRILNGVKDQDGNVIVIKDDIIEDLWSTGIFEDDKFLNLDMTLSTINSIVEYGAANTLSSLMNESVLTNDDDNDTFRLPGMIPVQARYVARLLDRVDENKPREGVVACPRCKSTNTFALPVQKRSADEGLSISGTCNACRSKFTI